MMTRLPVMLSTVSKISIMIRTAPLKVVKCGIVTRGQGRQSHNQSRGCRWQWVD